MKYIEKELPIQEINLIAEFDMTFKYMKKDFRENIKRLLHTSNLKYRGIPKIHNVMYYPARIPPSATRAVSLASVIEYKPDITGEVFLRAIGLENARRLARESGTLATLYMANPDAELVKKLLERDPKEITVVDPMAGGGSIPPESLRLGFRTIAGDYNPVAYLILRATIEFPAKYGRRLYELVNKEAKALIEYAKRELGKFYNEGVKNYLFFIGARHECGGVVPLTKHTLLSRKKKIHVRPVFNKESRVVSFEIVEESPAISTAVCPYCDRSVSENMIRGDWVRKHVEILETLLNGDTEKAKEAPSIYILASVQLERGRYRPANDLDKQMLITAAEELARCAREEKERGGDIRDYLPVAEIPDSNEVFNKLRSYGIRFWHQLFNPRQLLALYKLTKYIKSRAEELYKAYGELGAAVVLYLALAVAKMFNYNNILTQWHPGSEVIGALVGSHYALGKKVNLGYDYGEGNFVYMALPWALESEEEEEAGEEHEVESTRGGILPVLKFLCDRLEGLWKEGLDAVYLWDARELDEHLPEGSVDLINVDPPYYDQHDYAGITEFFWVIMQQTLWSVLSALFPRNRVKLDGWRPEEPEIHREVEISGEPPRQLGARSRFGEAFGRFLEAASKVLKPDGLMVVWYAYGKLHGWEELFRLFYDTGYGVTKTWQVWSQSRQRRVALQRESFFTSMVIVARPRAERATVLRYDDPLVVENVRNIVRNSMNTLLAIYGFDALSEALVISLADGYAHVTFYNLPSGLGLYQNLSTTALRIAVLSVMESLSESFGVSSIDFGGLDNESRLYTFLLLTATEDLRISSDFVNRVSQVLRSDTKGIVRRSARGSMELLTPVEVAKRPKNTVVSRSISLIEEVRRVLENHGIRAAEDVVMGTERSAVSLARFLVATSWNKLGVRESEKETLLKVLSVGGM